MDIPYIASYIQLLEGNFKLVKIHQNVKILYAFLSGYLSKTKTHMNKITNQICYFSAVKILLAISIMWVFIFPDNQPEKQSIQFSNTQ